MTTGIYTVTGDAEFLEGWTPETLAEALEGPLGEMGIEVECKPNQYGGVGYEPEDENSPEEYIVESIVERVVTMGF